MLQARANQCRSLVATLAGRALFPEPELANSGPLSRAGWGCSMVARSPMLIHGPALAQSKPLARASPCRFLVATLAGPVLVPEPELVNAGSLSRAGQFQVMVTP